MEQSHFAAAVVTYGILDDSVDSHVGWSEAQDGNGRHFIVMLAPDDDEDYCIVVGDASGHATHYGGITSAQVEQNETVLTLEPSAADELGLSTDVRISHEDVDTEAVRRHMTSILTGSAD